MSSIKIYGDSVLKGVIFNEELHKYQLYGDRYADLASSGIDVENNSKMGATIDEGFEIIKDTLKECDGDTIVVMEYGGNDCNFDWDAVSEDPDGEFEPITPEDKFVSKYVEAVDYAKSKGARVVICTLVPIEAQRFMNWISRGLNYENILEFIGDVDMLSRWQEYYSNLAAKVAHITGSGLLDLRSAFLKRKVLINNICIDGIHPNAEGHKLISEIIKNNISAGNLA